MDRRRLIYYLLLNVLVSAVVTVTILFIYDRSRRAVPSTPLIIPTLSGSTADVPPNNAVKVNILSVIGAGNAGSEVVVIQNAGTQRLVLTGWHLRDGQGITYTFPDFTLSSGVSIDVHTTTGRDTPVDLYWNRSDPVWTPGELATLFDADGVAQAFYRIP